MQLVEVSLPLVNDRQALGCRRSVLKPGEAVAPGPAQRMDIEHSKVLLGSNGQIAGEVCDVLRRPLDASPALGPRRPAGVPRPAPTYASPEPGCCQRKDDEQAGDPKDTDQAGGGNRQQE